MHTVHRGRKTRRRAVLFEMLNKYTAYSIHNNWTVVCSAVYSVHRTGRSGYAVCVAYHSNSIAYGTLCTVHVIVVRATIYQMNCRLQAGEIADPRPWSPCTPCSRCSRCTRTLRFVVPRETIWSVHRSEKCLEMAQLPTSCKMCPLATNQGALQQLKSDAETPMIWATTKSYSKCTSLTLLWNKHHVKKCLEIRTSPKLILIPHSSCLVCCISWHGMAWHDMATAEQLWNDLTTCKGFIPTSSNAQAKLARLEIRRQMDKTVVTLWAIADHVAFVFPWTTGKWNPEYGRVSKFMVGQIWNLDEIMVLPSDESCRMRSRPEATTRQHGMCHFCECATSAPCGAPEEGW